MTKAKFDSKQPAVQSFTVDEKTTVQICLNEKTETITPEEGEAYTQYVYDFNEFTDETGKIDLTRINESPESYLNYQPAAEPSAEERLAELEQAVQDMALAQMGGDE